MIVIVLLCLACIAVVIYHLATLTQFPPVLIDEPWYSDAAWNWLNSGLNMDTMHEGGRIAILWPYIGNIPLLLSFYLFGLGLIQARIVSWIFGIFLLLMTALVGRRLYGTLAGITSALLLSISLPYLMASHYYRPDIILASSAMLCFWLILIGQDQNKWWANLLAGTFIALSIDIHQNAIIIMIAFGIFYLHLYRRAVYQEKNTWLFIIGCTMGMVYYLLVVVLPHQADFVSYYGFTLATTHRIPLFTLNPMAIIQAVRAEIGRYRFFDNILNLMVIVASIVYLSFRRTKADRSFLVYTGALFTGFALLTGNKEQIYAIYLYPNLMIIVAAAILAFANGQRKIPQRVFILALISVYLFSSVYYLYQSIATHREYDYYANTTKLKENIPFDARVMGMPQWWFGFYDQDYRSINSLSYLHFLKGYSLTQGLIEIHPDILIVDPDLRNRLVDENYFADEGFESYNLPKPEFEAFLTNNGKKVSEFIMPMVGRIEIYSLHWNHE